MAKQSQLNYENFKAQQLREASVIKIYGIPLDVESKSIERFGGHKPLVLCLCNHDSPDNPCPCNWILWLPLDKIINSRITERKNNEENEIHCFEVQSDARVNVEKILNLNIKGLATLSDLSNATGGASVIYSKTGKFKNPLAAAFGLGVAIGDFLNEELDLTDTLSDWLMDTFGPIGK